jgi:hypothetical protein
MSGPRRAALDEDTAPDWPASELAGLADAAQRAEAARELSRGIPRNRGDLTTRRWQASVVGRTPIDAR